MRIALISDTHTTRGTSEDKPRYARHLDQVIAQVNAAQVDVVLIAGDLTDSGAAQERADFQAQITGFEAPTRVIPGNHDVGDKTTEEGPGTVTAQSVLEFEQAYGPSFWSDTQFGLRIVGINSPMLGSDLPREAEQWAFLDSEFAPSSSQPTVLLTHYPPFTVSPDEPSDRYWNIEPRPRQRLLAALKQAGVTAVLSGHLHSPLHTEQDGITYVTTQPVSFGLPFGEQTEGWTLIMIAADGAVSVQPHNVDH